MKNHLILVIKPILMIKTNYKIEKVGACKDNEKKLKDD